MRKKRTKGLVLIGTVALIAIWAADGSAQTDARGSLWYNRAYAPAPANQPNVYQAYPASSGAVRGYAVLDCWDPYRMRAVSCSELEYLQRNRIAENRGKNADCWDFSREMPDYCRGTAGGSPRSR